LPVLLEDDDVIAIDKPAGVAVHGGSGISFGVIEQMRRARPELRFLELVHRLDRETSGVLLLAKKRAALLALQAQMRPGASDKTMAKIYVALVEGTWPDNLRVIDLPLYKYVDGQGERRVRVVAEDDADGRRAMTLVKVMRRFDAYTLLEVTLKTGRTHQIRVHLAHRGHPVAGDDKYGERGSVRALARGESVPGCRFDRMFLHARRLRFLHPSTSDVVELVAPLPASCAALLEALPAGAGVDVLP
jgi:23S rRNA pseudouridine955/2504/2580 synthase